MKKWILLLIIPFLLTGCYDYRELDSRAIVSGIAIDLKDDKFVVTLEILNSKKSDSEKESTEKTYYVEGDGATISEAIQKCNLKVSKDAYYSHLKVVVMSETFAKEKMDKLIDYFLRDPYIRNIFIPIIAEGSDASEIIKTVTTANPVSSEAIQSLIENNRQSNHIGIEQDFELFADAFVDLRKDALMNTVRKEEETIVLSGIAAFRGDKLATILNQEEAAVFNVLSNNSKNHLVSTYCNEKENKRININLYQNKDTSIEYKNGKLNIKSNLLANVVEDECDYDFRDPNVYPEIEKLFDKVVEDNFKSLIKKLQIYQTDILKINDSFYKKNRKDLANWYTLDLEFETEIDVNKNGLIFKVTHDK